MYVAVKGGEQAILNSYIQVESKRRGDVSIAELTVAQICSQLRLAVDRVMTEGSVSLVPVATTKSNASSYWGNDSEVLPASTIAVG